MLTRVTGSLSAIAAVIGSTSAQSVFDWRSGAKQPSAPARARMYAALGIPVQAWQQRAKETEDDGAAAEPEPDPVIGSALEECLQLLATIKRDRVQRNLLPAERVKLTDAEARLLKLRAELEARAELSEDRYVREHPAWLRARNLISAALKPYPEAARAVADALEASGI